MLETRQNLSAPTALLAAALAFGCSHHSESSSGASTAEGGRDASTGGMGGDAASGEGGSVAGVPPGGASGSINAAGGTVVVPPGGASGSGNAGGGMVDFPSGGASGSGNAGSSTGGGAGGERGGDATGGVPGTGGQGGDVGDIYDAPGWIAAMPVLANGRPWDAGIPGGIPAGSVDTTLTTDQMTATGINSALAEASSRGGPEDIRVVQMPAGTFPISGDIEPRSYTILRGAGPWGAGRTRLQFAEGAHIFNNWPTFPDSAANVVLPVGGSLPIGSTQVEVSDASQFAVGDIIQLDQLNDLSYVMMGDGQYHCRRPDYTTHGPRSSGGFRNVVSLHQVTAIDGTTLSFEPPTRMRYDETYDVEAWRSARRDSAGLWYAGLEEFSLSGPREGGIVLNQGAYVWVKNIETDGENNGGISDDHVRFQHIFRGEIRRVYAHHSTLGPVSGGGSYGLLLDDSTSESLIIDSISVFMNKLIQTNTAGAGNVFAYNYADNTSANGGDWIDGAVNGSHQSFTHHLLFEGNWGVNIGCDTTHGNSGFLAFLRNYGHGTNTVYESTGNRRAANVDGWMRESAFFGNVLGTNGLVWDYHDGDSYNGDNYIWRTGQFCDGGTGECYDGVGQPDVGTDGRQPTFTTRAFDKLWRHGNWDAATGSIADWDPDFPSHVVPQSLFLTQKPDFFGSLAWPWVEPTGSTQGNRVQVLPAKARYDAGEPFADAD